MVEPFCPDCTVKCFCGLDVTVMAVVIELAVPNESVTVSFTA